MKKLKTRHYTIYTEKIKGQGGRFVMLTDLHGASFGPENCGLRRAIESCRPDAVLIAGDMIIKKEIESLKPAQELITALADVFPVYYALGNHEYRLLGPHPYQRQYLEYEKALKEAGVCFLHNQRTWLTVGEDRFTIYGLEIPEIYYHKPVSPQLTQRALERMIGRPEQGSVNLLLAHNPKYGDAYLEWGADLTLCGHYHGGVLRFTRHIGAISPQLQIFPPYCCGDFHRGKRHMLVSAGLGEHTIPLRIHNPRELLVIDIRPARNTKNVGNRRNTRNTRKEAGWEYL